MVVNIRFFINKSIFVCFIFVFASSAPFYNTGGRTQFVKFRFLDSFLNEKMKIKPHENYPLYGSLVPLEWQFPVTPCRR